MTIPALPPASPAKEQLWSAIRDCLKIAGAVLATKGLIDESLIEPGIGVIMIAGPVLWSQISARLKHRKMLAFAAEFDATI